MTVLIASKRGIWADSKVTNEETSYRATKIIRWRGELIGMSGSNPGIERFLFWYRTKRCEPIERPPKTEGDKDDENCFEIVVVSRRGVYAFGDCSFPDLVLDEYYYGGDGAAAAQAAMVAGADPRRAIEIACQVVSSCGLPVQEELL